MPHDDAPTAGSVVDSPKTRTPANRNEGHVVQIGKYVTNPGVIGAAFGAMTTARRTKSMRNDWRRFLVWGVWLAGLALAVAGVAMQEQDEEYAAGGSGR